VITISLVTATTEIAVVTIHIVVTVDIDTKMPVWWGFFHCIYIHFFEGRGGLLIGMFRRPLTSSVNGKLLIQRSSETTYPNVTNISSSEVNLPLFCRKLLYLKLNLHMYVNNFTS